MRRRDLRSREPFAAIAYLDYHDVTKVNWCPWPPTPRSCASISVSLTLNPMTAFDIEAANRSSGSRPQAQNPLTEAEVADVADTAIAQVAEEIGERPGLRQMGQVMKAATAIAAGKADGARLSAAVKDRL